MGINSSQPSNIDLEYFNDIKLQCQLNKHNHDFLVKILKTEWSNVVQKWNTGKLHGHHLNVTTWIIGTINDYDLNPIYTKLITNWNKFGDINISDYNDVSEYINKM